MEKYPDNQKRHNEELFDINNANHLKELSKKINIPEDQIKKAKELHLTFYRSIGSEKYQNLAQYLKFIQEKYNDNSELPFRQSAVYNIIVGGSFAIQDIKFWDYENEDSILKKVKTIFSQEIENTNE